MTDFNGIDPNQSRFVFDALKLNLGTAFSSEPENPLTFGFGQRVELILPYRLNGIETKAGESDPNAIFAGFRAPIEITPALSVAREPEGATSYAQTTKLNPQIFLARQNHKSILTLGTGIDMQQIFSVPASAEDQFSAKPHVSANIFYPNDSFAYTPDLPLFGIHYTFANINPDVANNAQSAVVVTANPMFAEKGIASFSGLSLAYKNQITPMSYTNEDDETMPYIDSAHTFIAGSSVDMGPTEVAFSYSFSKRSDSQIEILHRGEDFPYGSTHTLGFEFGAPLLALIRKDDSADITAQDLQLQEERELIGHNIPFSLKGSYAIDDKTQFSEDPYIVNSAGVESLYDGSATYATPYHRQESSVTHTVTLKPTLSIPTPNERFTFKMSGEFVWTSQNTEFSPVLGSENTTSQSATVLLGLNYNWNVPKK